MPNRSDFYTTYGEIQDALLDFWRENGRKQSFIEILRMFDRQGKLVEQKKPVPLYFDLLSDNDFIDSVRQLPVDARNAIDHSNLRPSEAAIFPAGKDVFAICRPNMVAEELHRVEYFDLYFIYSGDCLLRFENQQILLSANDLIILAPHSWHAVESESNAVIINIMIRTSTFITMFWNLIVDNDQLASFFRNALSQSKEPNYIHFTHVEFADQKRLYQRLIWESNQTDQHANLFCVTLINQIFISVVRSSQNRMNLLVKSTGTTRFDFESLIGYMRKNYRDISLRSLAETFHYNEAHLSVQIQKKTGQTFSAIIRGIRMQQAVDFLIKTNYSIAYIADLVGYESADHFTRVFRATFKMSPALYRKSNRHNAGESINEQLERYLAIL